MGDRFTAIGSREFERPHSRICRHAVRSTHSPTERISPESSSTGMKLAGDTAPSSPLSQRMSASAPEMRPLARSQYGW